MHNHLTKLKESTDETRSILILAGNLTLLPMATVPKKKNLKIILNPVDKF